MPYRIVKAQPGEQLPQEEGWGQYLTRNIAKTPAALYESARSGLGIGDVFSTLQKGVSSLAGLDPATQAAIERATEARGALTSQAGQKEIASVLPKYFTEHKPEDYYPRLLQGNILPFLTSGGASSAPAAISSLKSLAGAHAGGEITRGAASAFGAPEELADILAIPGSVAGGLAAHAISPTQLPSTSLNKKAFTNKKAQQLGELEQQKSSFENRIKDLNQLSTENYAKAEEIAPRIKADATKLREAIIDSSQSMAGIESAERMRINNLLISIDDLIEGNSINLKSAKDLKKNLRGTVYDKNLPTSIRNFGKRMHHEVSELIKQAGEINPDHGIPFEKAESAYTELKDVQKQQKDFLKTFDKEKNSLEKQTYKDYVKSQQENFVDRVLKEGKSFGYRQSVLHALRAVMGNQFSWIAGLLGEGLVGAGKELNRIRVILKENPVLKAEVKNAAKLIAKKDWPAATAAVHKLDEEFKKLENEPQQGQWRIVRKA